MTATFREEKNAAESEFDRLAKMRDIQPYSGNRKADQIKARYMGPMVEEIIGSLVTNHEYEKLYTQEKSIYDCFKRNRSTVNGTLKICYRARSIFESIF